MALFSTQFEILHLRHLLYSQNYHVITSLIPRLSHTVQYGTESWGGAWEWG